MHAPSDHASSDRIRRAFVRASRLASLCAIATIVPTGCEKAPAPRPPAPVPTAAAPAAPSAPTGPVSGDATTAASAERAAADAASWRTSTSSDDPAVLECAGLKGPKPATWVWTKPSMQFRTLQYAVPGGADSTMAAELVVSVFVAGYGGPLDANIERWRRQFRTADGFAEAKRSSTEVGPLKVEWVELAGEFMSMGAPAPKDGFRQLAAIVQAPGRNVFFRLVGPDATVEANRADFTKLIEGLMPAD